VPSNNGGTSGVGGTTSGGDGGTKPVGGTGGTRSGGAGGNADDDERTVYTHGGCSLTSASDPSSLGVFLFAAAAFFGVTRRRSRRAAP
jgi:MYXO-CTERM domain-containing protein